jgi:hypothetical protein
MDMKLKESFLTQWRKYFNGADLPLVFYYSSEPRGNEIVKPPAGHRCVFADLLQAQTGKTVCFDAESLGCFGGKRYLGYTAEVMPNFEYFLSCGIPGKLEGERYKKTPNLVKQFVEQAPQFKAPARYIIFKRWDMLEELDDPEVVIFLARPDILSGLFTLANFDEARPDGVWAPFAAGCGSIVQYPYLDINSEHPRAVLGMFDVSARPFIPEDALSFSVPMNRFTTMIENIPESFLITKSWKAISQRITQKGSGK